MSVTYRVMMIGEDGLEWCLDDGLTEAQAFEAAKSASEDYPGSKAQVERVTQCRIYDLDDLDDYYGDQD